MPIIRRINGVNTNVDPDSPSNTYSQVIRRSGGVNTVVWNRIVARAFAISDWTGVVSIDVLGNVSVTQGNSRITPTFTPTTFGGRVASDTPRTVSVTIGVPDDPMWTNRNTNITRNVMATQPQGIFVPTVNIHNTDPSHNAIVVDWTVDAMNGSISSQSVEYGTTTAYGNTVNGVGASDRTATITGLNTETTYFIRVSATNEAGTGRDTASARTTVAPLQPADIITGISVNIDGDLTVTTNSRGFVYYLGEAATGGTTYTSASNSVTIDDLYPLVNQNTGRTPFIGIEVDDSTVPNDGAQLSIRTIQTVTQPPALANITLSSVSAGQTFADISGAINSAGAAATSAAFVYAITDSATPPSDLATSGTSISVSTAVGSKSERVTFDGAFEVRYFHALMTASTSRGTSTTNVLSDDIAALSIEPNTITTNAATNIGETSVTLNGTIGMGAGNTIGTTGFIYSTSASDLDTARASSRGTWPSSVVDVVRTPDSYGDYSASVTGLDDDTTYYFAAYTVNPTGHTYGSREDFTTQETVQNTISVLPVSMTFDGAGDVFGRGDGTFTVTIQPSTATFSVSDNRSWISTAVNGNVVTVTVDSPYEPSPPADRTGTITVRHGSDTSVTATVEVTQNAFI